MRSKAICVLGMHRSGTSTVSRAISLLGAYLGEEADLLPPAPDNPEGFWERKDIVDLQDRLLSALHQRWDTALPLPEGWHREPEIASLREELRSILATVFNGCPLWAWKDPRTCILMNLWKDLLAELGTELAAVFVMRHPLDIANSLVKRNGFSLEKSYGIWFNYNLAALQAIQGIPTAFISYDNFLDESEKELRRCAATLDISWPAKDVELKKLLSSFLRKDLRHSKSKADTLKNAPRPVRELQELLSVVLDDPAAINTRFFARVEELRLEFIEYTDFFQSDIKDCFDHASLIPQLKEELTLNNQQLAELDHNLAGVNQQLTERDRQLAERGQQLADMGQQLVQMDQQIAERDVQIEALRSRLQEILNSISWKFTGPARTLAKIIIGRGK